MPALGPFTECMMRYMDMDGAAVIVGRLGMHQLGAVGLSNMVFFFVTVFFSFLLVVTTPRVADALAVGNRDQVRIGCLTYAGKSMTAHTICFESGTQCMTLCCFVGLVKHQDACRLTTVPIVYEALHGC